MTVLHIVQRNENANLLLRNYIESLQVEIDGDFLSILLATDYDEIFSSLKSLHDFVELTESSVGLMSKREQFNLISELKINTQEIEKRLLFHEKVTQFLVIGI